MVRWRRAARKSRHARQPPRVCLIRIASGRARARGGGQQDSRGRVVDGAIAQLEKSGRIISSSIAAIDGAGATYWMRLRSRLPADAIVMAAPIPGYINVELADVESAIFRRVRADGKLGRPSSRGRRIFRTMYAMRTIANRSAHLGRRGLTAALAGIPLR